MSKKIHVLNGRHLEGGLLYPDRCKVYVRHSEEESCGELARYLAAELGEMSYNAVVISPDNHVRYHRPDLHSSRLALFVLTDAFFKNQDCLIDVLKLKSYEVPMISLFYKLSMSEFKNEEGRELWRKEWKRRHKGHMAMWERAVEILDSCHAIEYGTRASSITQYVQAIVEAVSSRARLQVYWSEESRQVQGRIEMCESVDSSFIGTSVLGIWGIWGVGKSTLGKALCDFYFPEFGGRVCYVELDSTPLAADRQGVRLHRLNQILEKLFETSGDFLEWHVRDLGQAHAYLDYCLGQAFKKVFLVVDNIQDSLQSFEEARDLFVRKVPFPRGSKVLLLARSSHTLRQLLQPLNGNLPSCVTEFPRLSSSCDYYPILFSGLSEAKTAKLSDTGFAKSICDSCHPLTIQSAGCFFQSDKSEAFVGGSSFPSWEISKIRLLDKMYETLQKSYDLLEPEEQRFFLDIALFMPNTNIQRLRQLHDPPDEIFSSISKYIRKLRSEAFLTIKGRQVEVHAVCRGFANWIIQKDFRNKMIYEAMESVSWHSRAWPISLQRVACDVCEFEGGLQGPCILDFSRCKHLRVLRLWKNKSPTRIEVRLGEFSMLESVEILSNECPVTVTGDFSNVKCFKGDAGAICYNSKVESDSALEQCIPRTAEMPEGLQVLEIFMPSQWSAEDHLQHFVKCINLDVLRVHRETSYDSSRIEGGEIDLSTWINLRELVLEDAMNLKVLCGLHKLHNLRVLHLAGLNELTSLSGTEALHKLEEFHLLGCSSLSILRLPGSKLLSHCCIDGCESLKYIEVMEGEEDGQSSDNEEEDEVLVEDRLWIMQCTAADSGTDEDLFILNSLRSTPDREGLVYSCFRFCHTFKLDPVFGFNDRKLNKVSVSNCWNLRAVMCASRLTAIRVFEFAQKFDVHIVNALDFLRYSPLSCNIKLEPTSVDSCLAYIMLEPCSML